MFRVHPDMQRHLKILYNAYRHTNMISNWGEFSGVLRLAIFKKKQKYKINSDFTK